MKLRAYCKPTLPFHTLDFSLGEDNSLSVSFFLPLSLLISHLSDSLDSAFSVSLFMGGRSQRSTSGVFPLEPPNLLLEIVTYWVLGLTDKLG